MLLEDYAGMSLVNLRDTTNHCSEIDRIFVRLCREHSFYPLLGGDDFILDLLLTFLARAFDVTPN